MVRGKRSIYALCITARQGAVNMSILTTVQLTWRQTGLQNVNNCFRGPYNSYGRKMPNWPALCAVTQLGASYVHGVISNTYLWHCLRHNVSTSGAELSNPGEWLSTNIFLQSFSQYKYVRWVENIGPSVSWHAFV